MRRLMPFLLCAGLLAASPDPAVAKGPLREPDEGPDPRGLTITGTGVVQVAPPRRPTRRAIERAVAAAQPRATTRALREARERAEALAASAGLTLGAIQAIDESDPTVELGFTPRGPRCGRRCTDPIFATAALSVTFATTQTSAAVPAGRALVTAGTAVARVRPRSRRNDGSIRVALAAARLSAAPRSLASARRDVTAIALAAGLQPGPLFSIAEVRRPFDEVLSGFGPGRFCGMIRRRIVRRDPATGRRRVVGHERRHRCFFPRETTVALRLTHLPR